MSFMENIQIQVEYKLIEYIYFNHFITHSIHNGDKTIHTTRHINVRNLYSAYSYQFIPIYRKYIGTRHTNKILCVVKLFIYTVLCLF